MSDSKKTPFVKKKVPCPVCSSEAENRFIMPKSYVEKDKESDRHAKTYKWLDDDFKDYHPPYYHFWHCPTCKYTATQRDFLKPGEDQGSNFNTIKRCIQQMKPNQKQIVQMLGSDIDYERMNFSMAMNLHLLALYLQQLPPEPDRDPNKIASYYLRTGWLIREQMGAEDPGGQFKEYKAFLEKLSKLWSEVPQSEADCLNAAAAQFKKAYQTHPKYSDILQASDLMLLIADLYIRAGDTGEAMQCLNTVMQTGQKYRSQVGETIRKDRESGKLTVSRKSQLDAQSNRVNQLMERAGDMRDEITKAKMKEQEPKARKVIAKLEERGMETEDIREKMKELEFEPKLITKLLGEPKRKKFLGLF